MTDPSQTEGVLHLPKEFGPGACMFLFDICFLLKTFSYFAFMLIIIFILLLPLYKTSTFNNDLKDDEMLIFHFM